MKKSVNIKSSDRARRYIGLTLLGLFIFPLLNLAITSIGRMLFADRNVSPKSATPTKSRYLDLWNKTFADEGENEDPEGPFVPGPDKI